MSTLAVLVQELDRIFLIQAPIELSTRKATKTMSVYVGPKLGSSFEICPIASGLNAPSI